MDSEENVPPSQSRSSQSALKPQKDAQKPIDYSYEEERIKSFVTWEVYYPVDPVRLAKAGFYHSGRGDEVICFSCKGHVKNWNYGDVVLKKHAELFPDCDFVNNRSNNIPIIPPKKFQNHLRGNNGKVPVSNQAAKVSQGVGNIDYNKMRSVQERLKTFACNWPLSYVDVSKIAQAGFFYLGLEDKVQCPFCKGIVSNWEDADDPLKEHMKHFPWCDYLSGIISGFNHKKMPWFKVDSEDVCGNTNKSVSIAEKCKLLDKNQEHMNLTRLGVHLYSDPAHPQQASYSARLRSFSSWPDTAPIAGEELAKAGFFYIGISDHTKCFHCNGGLCNWEQGDDPWMEHAKWFRNCEFLRFNKGEAFIAACVEKQHSTEKLELDIPTQQSSLTSPESLLAKVDELMSSSIVKKVLESSVFPPYIIRAAILRQLRDTGNSFSTVDELCTAASYLKDEMLQEPSRQNCDPSDLNIQGIDMSKCAIGSDGHDVNMESSGDNLHGASNALPKVNGKLKEYGGTLPKDQCLCKICMDKEVGIVFLPCGHLLACTDCAPALKLCPMCRKAIQAIVRAYLP
ncbi:baculoviral IAP repeat-containing protein 7-B-like isoform X2 [Argiope bruennichi]|uniref:Death-associated inhibitor of apoptosis 2 like protein n=2 Tax=Argiope bruennichi TaxID=94029 RepID=A0A8T0F3V9_ARGBR|nr:baculoviral IAP repeat-containing protein 7-B-like isoform X2 [Argiope bruennichi]XP_055927140.1 baculoviral IAP repeat-containing protein 7-B-like isoform X2 [Argiope bruennichi]KAF8785531.1 Death-associated inhibitor of apoptosis 2 like protein [Argiope bruennichi]